MKTLNHFLARRTLAIVTIGLALDGLFSATAQTSIYRMQSNYVAGTTAPYSAGGGVPAQALLTLNSVTSTNCTLSWYGMMGWYAVQASPDMINWTTVTNVEASNFGWRVTVTNLLGPSASFRLSQSNSYAGQGNCSGCHGDKYSPWSQTAHASALSTLASIHQDNNPNCLLCHTVGFNQPTGYTDQTNTPYLANVGCEACHGPAGWHKNSDHAVVRPAVSLDPAICGSCHQGSMTPTYQEYITTNSFGLFTGLSHSHPTQSAATSSGCAVCHSANNRMVMLDEYNDKLAGNPHSLTLFTGSDATAWTATCATCHDPHSSNQVAQLRYPTSSSTNWFTMPTTFDSRKVVTTNFDGSTTTTTVNLNTVFDTLYNPNIQVCAQCHNTRGARWDGNAYAVITNTPLLGLVTNTAYVDIYCTNVITQVFTNSQGVPYLTNNYLNIYVCGRYATTNVSLSQTNPLYGVGVVTPLVYYTNADNSIGFGTNSSGYSRVPHYSPQYNILIGNVDYDYQTVAGVTNKTHNHTSAPDQCASCHVPSYSVNANTNVTGHTFALDTKGCALAGCHTTYTEDALRAKINNLQFIESNSMVRVVSLLNQWALTKTAGTLLTNFGQLAWEYTSPGLLGTKTIQYSNGPFSTFTYLSTNINIPWWPNGTNWPTPSFTNDNLQLLIPQDIRIARNDLYMAYNDQSMGVHNPTYVQALLDDAATRVSRQFTAANFTAGPVAGFASLTVLFTNLGTGITNWSWDFGDGVGPSTSANPSHTYATPGTYSVTFTANGVETLVKTNYIRVLTAPSLSFVADNTNVAAGTTVNFTITSTTTNGVFRYAWYPMNGVSGSPNYATAGGSPFFSFTYTSGGVYNVAVVAYCPGGANGSYNRVTNTINAYITVAGANFSGTPTKGTVPFAVGFTNLSVGCSNYLWTFGDGNTSTGVNPVNTYSNAGTYTVTLSAVNNGLTNSMVRTGYIVANPAPVAFTGSPVAGLMPLTVTFVNTSSNATSFLWNFGDGGTSTSLSPIYTYNNAGTNTVTLQAFYATNNVVFKTNTLARTNYIVASPLPVAGFTAAPTNGWSPLAVTFTNQSTNATSYVWIFGDGTTTNSVNPVHTYTATNSRPYTVTLQAISYGLTNTATIINCIHVAVP